MSFPILQEYEQGFPMCTELIHSFTILHAKKLWHELTTTLFQFVYHPQVKGKLTFRFYTEFIRNFQKNINQINLLKILKETLVSLPQPEALKFLQKFEEKEAFAQETKIILQGFQGYYHLSSDLKVCSSVMQKMKIFVEQRKDVDSFVYSTYYRLCIGFYAAKRKYKSFYSTYTSPTEMEPKEQLKMLFEMALAVLVSEDIYNFSELLEQPLLASLQKSDYFWIYELLEIFNRGDINRFESAVLQHEQLQRNKVNLQKKIRLMAFLELVFNLSKSDRVISFERIARVSSTEEVELLVMKAMALKLVRGSIDELKKEVTISWVAPKVLENERVGVMLSKFVDWEKGIEGVQTLMAKIKSN